MKNQVQKTQEFTSLQNPTQEVDNTSFFETLTANEWMEKAKEIPIAKMLFSELWHENEVCILFADSNVGKSILSVQIANSISKGEPINGFQLAAIKQPVLYIDFELTVKQFEIRYSEKDTTTNTTNNHYAFDDYFIRIELNPDAEIPVGIKMEDQIINSIEESIDNTGSKILIIDNITYLNNETDRSKEALPLMKELKLLKNRHGLSILILAHTPKRDMSRMINQNDLGGSKMVFNFADSCFSIGLSSLDPNMRYIKQLKARNTEIMYGAENVIVCKIEKATNFLSFSHIGYGNELDHLKNSYDNDRTNTIKEVKKLSAEGLTQREIKDQLGISLGAVNKYLNE